MGLGGAFGTYDVPYLIKTLLRALEKGVNFIDTARGYDTSEEIIGQALKQWKGERPFIASKIAPQGSSRIWGIPPPVEEVFPKGKVRQSALESLKKLDVDRIDLMQLHLYWPNWGNEGYWLDELHSLQTEGKIDAIGISVTDHRSDVALPLVLSGVINSVQTTFNIFDPLALDCLIPLCKQKKVAVLARCVLDEGGLTGFLKPDTTFAEKDFRRSFFNCVPKEMYIERVDRLRKFIPEHAKSLSTLALKFVLKDSGVTSALTSMHIAEYADENIAAADEAPLSDEVF